jgi:uncharacterized protein YggT (Ycf19 family)|tara:strand:- start:244 stop:663 length:420 start_codon:yes stop_codon:yes gene_type:complete
METFSTLLLTSSAPINHVLSSGELVELPNDVTFIFELSNIDIAQFLGFIRFVLVDGIRLFGFLYMLRFTIQFFGHINPYDGGLVETIYTFTEPYSRLFLGFLPSLYGVDMGLIVGFLVLDRVETIISNIVILDLAGKLY